MYHLTVDFIAVVLIVVFVVILKSNGIRFLPFQMGDYSVSLKAPGRNKHFRVHVENGMYCIGQRKFHSLDQLGMYFTAMTQSNAFSMELTDLN